MGSNGRRTTGPHERNSIRPDDLASLRSNGEARTRWTQTGNGPKGETVALSERGKATTADHQVLGGRTVGSPSDVNQGDPALEMVNGAGSQSLHSSGEARNERGAKGGRKVMCEEKTSGKRTLDSAEDVG